MIKGFAINLPSGGTAYGVITCHEHADDNDLKSILTGQTGASADNIKIINAEDLLDNQYDCVGFLTTEYE